MAFNISKCKIMHVGRNNPEYEYTMRGTALSKTNEERDIGVTISKNMKPTLSARRQQGEPCLS
jgi:hypothetical protein